MRFPILLLFALTVSVFGQAFPGTAVYQAAFLKPAAAVGASYTTNTWMSSVTGGSESSVASITNGVSITVGASDIVVTDLGTYFTDGTYADVAMFVANSSCARIASGVVLVAGSTVNAFNWVRLASPVTLTSGQTYHILRESGGFNEFLFNGTWTIDSAASVNGGSYDLCADPGYRTVVNFKYYEP
jgi:hypothetical protein